MSENITDQLGRQVKFSGEKCVVAIIYGALETVNKTLEKEIEQIGVVMKVEHLPKTVLLTTAFHSLEGTRKVWILL